VQDGETQTGYGCPSDASCRPVDRRGGRRRCSAATRLLGSTKPATQRVTLVLEPRLTATVLGIVGSMLNGAR